MNNTLRQKWNTKNISAWQLFQLSFFWMMFGLLFGLNLFPNEIRQEITQTWLLALCLALAAGFVPLILLCACINISGGGTLPDIMERLMGKTVAKILSPIISVYYLAQAIHIVQIQASNVKIFLLEKTPQPVIIFVLCLCAVSIMRCGQGQLARICELCFPLVTALLLFMIFACGARMDFRELQVLLHPDAEDLPGQFLLAFRALCCLDAALLFSGSVKSGKQRITAVVCGYILPSLLVIVAFLVLVGTFTTSTAASLAYPFTELTRSLAFPSTKLLERFDIFFISIRVVASILFCAIAIYAASIFICSLCKKISIGQCSWSVGLAVFVGTLFSLNHSFSAVIDNISLWGEIVMMCVFIPVLFVLSLSKRKRKKLEVVQK